MCWIDGGAGVLLLFGLLDLREDERERERRG